MRTGWKRRSGSSPPRRPSCRTNSSHSSFVSRSTLPSPSASAERSPRAASASTPLRPRSAVPSSSSSTAGWRRCSYFVQDLERMNTLHVMAMDLGQPPSHWFPWLTELQRWWLDEAVVKWANLRDQLLKKNPHALDSDDEENEDEDEIPADVLRDLMEYPIGGQSRPM